MTEPEAALRGNLRKYESRNPLQQFFIRRFLKKVRSVVSDLPPGPVCEAGCGEGFVLRNLTEHGLLENRIAVGMDLDNGALAFASAHVPGISFACSSIYDLPFRQKEFECVILLEVLEHLESPGRALSEAVRVGKSLLVSVPHEPFFRTANFLRGKNLHRLGDDPEHIQHWGARSFLRLLGPYGEVQKFYAPFPWLLAFVKAG